MATRKLQVHPGEARTIAHYLDEREQLLQMLTGAVAVICAREGISIARLNGVEGEDTLVLDVPDELNPDRPESSTTGPEVVGSIPSAPNAESAGNGQLDGKNGHSSPVIVDAPDAGRPGSAPDMSGIGQFRHHEGSER